MEIIDLIRNACNAAKEQMLIAFNKWERDRYIKKMGITQSDYDRQFDPRRNIRAIRITDYYFGYAHVWGFKSARLHPFTSYVSWMEGMNAIADWCRQNCKGAWRYDIERVSVQTGLSQVGDGIEMIETPEYFINEISGGDVLFFAFESDKDYTMFLLRWT